jgi:cytochrome c-type biogenesis protein CcmH
MIWLAVALLAACVMAPVVWTLGARVSPRGRAEAAMALHRAQLVELDRDLAEGRIAPTEHATAQLEVQRRLLAASEMKDAAPRRAAVMPVLAALALVPILALGLYSLNGHPEMPSALHGKELALAKQHLASETAMIGQLRQVLAGLDPHSDRAREGYILLGNVEESRGQFAAAAEAWGKALDVRFDPLLAAQSAEAASRADGHVSPASAALFRRALAGAPPDAPWRAQVEQRLASAQVN